MEQFGVAIGGTAESLGFKKDYSFNGFSTTDTPCVVPMSVAISATDVDSAEFVRAKVKTLSDDYGVLVLATKCYDREPYSYPPSMNQTQIGKTVLYVFEIEKNSGAAIVESLGFKKDFSFEGFSKTDRPCVAQPGIPST